MRTIRSVRAILFALPLLMIPLPLSAQMRISVSFGPPAIPVYEQPLCPGEGYIWTPGYWAWDDVEADYYWVPGTWVLAPEAGFLWTPPYWAWDNGAYVFYDGYWGPQVGFYGGIVYGFGYFGSGYVGGRWQGDRFFYNRSVNNVNVVNVRNVYNETVVNNNITINRVSYNGGPGGVQVRPRPQEEAAARSRHLPPVAAQAQHSQTARSERELHASANRGRPPVAATPKPAAFRDRSVVPARAAGAPYNPPANPRSAQPRAGNTPANAVHPRDLPPFERPAPAENRKYQQQQEKVFAKQEQERQKLQRKQDQEDQRVQRQNADQARKQQIEQRHQQQTQQLQQRHVQQQQRIQERQPPPKR